MFCQPQRHTEPPYGYGKLHVLPENPKRHTEPPYGYGKLHVLPESPSATQSPHTGTESSMCCQFPLSQIQSTHILVRTDIYGTAVNTVSNHRLNQTTKTCVDQIQKTHTSCAPLFLAIT